MRSWYAIAFSRSDSMVEISSQTLSISTAVATKIVDTGYLTVEGIVDDDETSFIASTGLDEVQGKGIYAAAQAVAELTRSEEDGE